MQRLLLLGLALLVATAAHGAIYKWTDGEGNVIYSDQPHPGAEQLEAVGVQTLDTPPLPPPPPANPEPPKPLPYTELVIGTPANDATLRDNTGNVQVSVRLSPPLQTPFRHALQLYVDGQPYGDPGTTTSFMLVNVDRGRHTLRVAVVDGEGSEVKSSPPSVFQLHRASVLHRP
ncbi:MAG: DUF4124 domain-containing protein [Gammaproteobacteria bacterium]|nr:DUF4124 domain-containing protein [Gammaproteobacteria bacterium]